MRNALAYGKTQRRIVSAWVGTAFAQDDAQAARKHTAISFLATNPLRRQGRNHRIRDTPRINDGGYYCVREANIDEFGTIQHELQRQTSLASITVPRRRKTAGRNGPDNPGLEYGAVTVGDIELQWLPEPADWRESLKKLDAETGATAWQTICTMANTRLTAVQTMHLDRRIRRLFPDDPPPGLSTTPVRLAVLASSTVEHLLAPIRVGGARRGLWVQTYTPPYGQYTQDVGESRSGLHAFRPTVALFALDAYSLLAGFSPGMDAADVDRSLSELCMALAAKWRQVHKSHQCQVIQQTVLPLFTSLAGGNEHRLAGSRAWLVERLNMALRDIADAEGVDLLAVDMRVAQDGRTVWHDPALWYRAKQEIHPLAGPLYGDLVGRLLAAAQGRSSKCLVLDLDNTLWGGVIGDDGLAGIELGQGSAAGEAFVAFQHYAREMTQRGIILAVCSKNDESNALEPFERHPEMVLKRTDIACFVANWDDKASNLRAISERLNIGLDALVFVDDNPFERALVRHELPMVAVPELPQDPALYAACIANAGYFETLRITEEDRQRGGQYQANLQRESLAASTTDIPDYLRSLEMKMTWNRFDRIGQARVVQLINKTNQFNLTNRRTSHEAISALIDDDLALTLQIRLIDRFGDNGIIAIVIGKFALGTLDMHIDTWLMSCRVLGRQVEEATLNLIVAEAKRLGATRLIGAYLPTAKNGMVKDHYLKLGFKPLPVDDSTGTLWELNLVVFTPMPTFIRDVNLAQADTPVSA
jgi:FkbH-like protein